MNSCRNRHGVLTSRAVASSTARAKRCRRDSDAEIAGCGGGDSEVAIEADADGLVGGDVSAGGACSDRDGVSGSVTGVSGSDTGVSGSDTGASGCCRSGLVRGVCAGVADGSGGALGGDGVPLGASNSAMSRSAS